jgi:DNA repair exonuclease SbcCD ATPase subunit
MNQTTDNKQEKRLRSKWSELEDRCYQITTMLDELEDIERECEEISIKKTAAYMVLQKELQMLNKAQIFIESLWR